MKEKPKFNRAAFKKAIAEIESSGGKNLDNPNSSAAGRYHFLYRYIKDVPELKGVSKREFINSPELQEKIMDMAIDGNLKGFPSYEKNSMKLKAKYKTNLRVDEIAALTHFLGSGGVEKYLKDPKGFSVPGNNNATTRQYITRFNNAQGTVPSYKENPRRNYAPAQQYSQELEPMNFPLNNTINNSPDFSKHYIETEPVEEIYSSPDETYNEDQYRAEVNAQQQELLKQSEQANAEQQQFREGGMMRGLSEDDFIQFEGGGTHEENPLGGIPQGIGENGKMNTVEEGETKFSFDDGDYVFSNAIMIDGSVLSKKESSDQNKKKLGGKMTTADEKEIIARVLNNIKRKK